MQNNPQYNQQSMDWPTTIAALLTDALIGTAAAGTVHHHFPEFGDNWFKNEKLKKYLSGQNIRNLSGGLIGGGIGLGGGLAYKSLENYLSPLGNDNA